jgi:hypothetical protein
MPAVRLYARFQGAYPAHFIDVAHGASLRVELRY